MEVKSNVIYDLGKEILTDVYQKVFLNFGPIIDEKKGEQIFLTKLESEREKMNSLNKNINFECFKKFIRSPQINDILKNYLTYLVITNIFKTDKVDKIVEDDVIIYCIQVISENFQEISSDESILIIREFFEIVMGICTTKLNEGIFSDYIVPKKKIEYSTLLQSKYGYMYINCMQKVKFGLNSGFISKNTELEITKNTYLKALRPIYQMGFIYFLGEYKFNDFYIPPILFEVGRQIHNYRSKLEYNLGRSNYTERENWKNIFNNSDIIYVVGGAGYGKSLFLRNIINNYSKLRIENSQEYLLIYCDLKSYYTNGNSNKKSVIDFLQESMINITGLDIISKEFIQYNINLGRCIILLDALDEVPKGVRNELHKKLIGYFATCNLNNKICITSRDRGFIPQENIEVFEIFPLTDRDIKEYIDKMIALKKFKKEDKETFMKQAQVLIEKSFLNNFLVLSLLVNIYKAEKELPENKINLYKKCFDYIAKKREEEKSKIDYNWDDIYPLMKDSTFISLSVLAAPNNKDIKRESVEELLLKQYKTKYPDEVTADCAIKEFLEFCSNRTELFVPSSVDDKFKFFHRSFFEYFYSRYIHQCSDVAEMYELMSEFDIDSEVFELTVALVKEDNEIKYQKLIEYIFDRIDDGFLSTHFNSMAFCIMTLAMQAIDDAYYIQKYFEVIIQHNKFMTDNKICSINQKLLYMWVKKGIGVNEDKKEKFREVYENKCIIYIFTLLSSSRNQGRKEILINTELNLQKNIFFEMDYQFNIVSRKCPFYLMVYREFNNLHDLLESFDKNTFGKLVRTLSELNKKQKSEMKKGYNNYKTFNAEDRKHICEVLFKL